ncbi:MAG: GNAT family N-acetyltransferase [Pseudonocardiaceae bacterium]
MLNLAPEAWGSGLASLLHGHALELLRTWGFSEAILWVVTGNARARRFYEREGWHADGETLIDASRGFRLCEVRYRIRLVLGEVPGEGGPDHLSRHAALSSALTAMPSGVPGRHYLIRRALR